MKRLGGTNGDAPGNPALADWQVNPEPADVDKFGWVLAQGAVHGLEAVEERLSALLDNA